MNSNEVAFMMLNLIFNLASVGQCLRDTAAADRQHHVKKICIQASCVYVSFTLVPYNEENHKYDSNCGSCVQ